MKLLFPTVAATSALLLLLLVHAKVGVVEGFVLQPHSAARTTIDTTTTRTSTTALSADNKGSNKNRNKNNNNKGGLMWSDFVDMGSHELHYGNVGGYMHTPEYDDYGNELPPPDNDQIRQLLPDQLMGGSPSEFISKNMKAQSRVTGKVGSHRITRRQEIYHNPDPTAQTPMSESQRMQRSVAKTESPRIPFNIIQAVPSMPRQQPPTQPQPEQPDYEYYEEDAELEPEEAVAAVAEEEEAQPDFTKGVKLDKPWDMEDEMEGTYEYAKPPPVMKKNPAPPIRRQVPPPPPPAVPAPVQPLQRSWTPQPQPQQQQQQAPPPPPPEPIIKEVPVGVPPPQKISAGQVRSLFYLWNEALSTGDARIVAKRYWDDAMLIGTIRDNPRTNTDAIRDYFTDFLQLEPQALILDGEITMGHNWAKDTGVYEFTMGAEGDKKIKARYTFVYTFQNGQWKIAHDHSSFMPEATGRGQTITEDEVKTLFPLWNDALGTEDAKAVTKRYAKKAVLFPLDSDQSRAGKSAIENYYQTWLQEKKPQATVLESHVIIGDDWCQDTGVCEFEFADQSVVKARYSFVYVWEEGAWKISHQHCSAMPEMSTVSAAASSASSSTSGAPTTTTTTSTTTSTSAAPTSTIPSSSTTTSSAASTFPAAEEPAAAEEEE